jgi:hypothetical protein
MKNRAYLLLFSLLFAVNGLQAQTILQESNRNSNTSMADLFFLSVHSTTYLDFMTSPVSTSRVQVGNEPDPNGGLRPVYEDVPVQTSVLNLFSFGLEPRFNVLELSNEGAVGISVPFSFGVGQSYAANADVLGVESFGTLQFPLLAKLYFGTGSTYRSEKNVGVSIGGGVEYNRIGLFNLGQDDYSGFKRGWIMPVASIGFQYWRGMMPMQVNLKYGLTPTTNYYVDRNGNTLTDGSGNPREGSGRGRTFRISFGYILNY